MDYLQDLNLRISECEKLAKVVDRENAEDLREYIEWVKREQIPFEKIYDV